MSQPAITILAGDKDSLHSFGNLCDEPIPFGDYAYPKKFPWLPEGDEAEPPARPDDPWRGPPRFG